MQIPPPTAPAHAPAAPEDRIAAIDALRGFALFGILVVNMSIFSMPWLDEQASRILFPGVLDRAVDWAVQFFAETKFVSLFAFLFGLSTWLQGQRTQEPRLQRRRLWVLLLFGLAHALLLWSGDVLVLYALLGLALGRFRQAPPRTLAIWISICLAVPVLAGGLLTLLDGGSGSHGTLDSLGQLALQVYQGGTYGEIFLFRLFELLMIYLSLILSAGAAQVFALFLCGLLAGKLSLFQQVHLHLPLFRHLFRWGLLAGAVGSLFLTEPGGSPLCNALGAVLGGSGMGLGYAGGLVLLAQRPGCSGWLAPLAAMGRMAFTNYLMQSVICTSIFYGYGLGLYGQVGPAAGLLLACAVYGAQVIVSLWWLKRFRFGPFEWLWRSLTYGRLQPLRP